jgi:hypothetical protein
MLKRGGGDKEGERKGRERASGRGEKIESGRRMDG